MDEPGPTSAIEEAMPAPPPPPPPALSEEKPTDNSSKIRLVLPSKNNVPFGTEGYRFRFPTNSHGLIVGPTQVGKTSFLLKLFIDGYDTPLGKLPFDKIIYVGVQSESDKVMIGAQVMNWTYTKTPPGTKPIPVIWVNRAEFDKLGALIKSEENRGLKKLIIVDDMLKEKKDHVTKSLFSLLGEGQHDNAYYWIVAHNASGYKDLRGQCNIRVLMKNHDPTDYTTLFGKQASADYSKIINYIDQYADEEDQLTKKIVIFSVLQNSFYNYNLNKIDI